MSATMISPATKDWVSVLTPIASVLAAITALALSTWVAYRQRQIQELQLRQNLFDKRYSIFQTVEDFMNYVLQNDGSINIISAEFRRFRDAREQAEFLFETDVSKYLAKLNETVLALYLKITECN